MATDQPVLHFPVNDNPQLMLFITFLTQFRNSSSIAEVLGQFPGDHSPLF